MIELIKVDAIGSTNSFLKELVKNKTISQATCLWAKNQTHGRGQVGNSWKTENGKNLTFSIYTPVPTPLTFNSIAINLLTSISIYSVLKLMNIPQLFIKWPNDIMSVNKKIGGILIENNYQNGVLSESIVGIGLNVNQENFELLPKASSLKKIMKHPFDLELLLNQILNQFQKAITNYTSNDFLTLKKQYENILFRQGKASTFKTVIDNTMFTGIIKGITNNGQLMVLKENGTISDYRIKEIELLY